MIGVDQEGRVAGGQGLFLAPFPMQQPGPLGVVPGQDRAARGFEPDRLLQVRRRAARWAGVDALRSRLASARSRYREAVSGRRSMARVNCSTA